ADRCPSYVSTCSVCPPASAPPRFEPIGGRSVSTDGSPRRMAGVTLIELMIAVVVISILAMIAVPSYRQYTQRAHRTEAKTALLQLQSNQERWYLQNNTYTADPASLGFSANRSENGVYTLSITAAAGGL